MSEKKKRVDLSESGASEALPALMNFLKFLKFRPLEFGLLKIRPYDFRPFIVRSAQLKQNLIFVVANKVRRPISLY